MIARAGTGRRRKRYKKAATDVVKWISLKAADITSARSIVTEKSPKFSKQQWVFIHNKIYTSFKVLFYVICSCL